MDSVHRRYPLWAVSTGGTLSGSTICGPHLQSSVGRRIWVMIWPHVGVLVVSSRSPVPPFPSTFSAPTPGLLLR